MPLRAVNTAMKFLVGLVALGCASAASAQLMGLPANSSNVRFQTLASGSDAKTNAPGLYVFNEPVGWENYWRAHHGGPIPQLEQGFFYNWKIVAIHSGNRPSAGYGLGVFSIQRNIDRAVISVIETVPPQSGRNGRGGSGRTTSPWILLRVEAGAFDFDLRTRQVAGYPTGAQFSGGGVTTIKIPGGTATFLPGGYGYRDECDHCRHRGRDGCKCGHGRDCDCRD